MNCHVLSDSRGDNKRENRKEGLPSRGDHMQVKTPTKQSYSEHGLLFMESCIQSLIFQIFTEYILCAITCGNTTVNNTGQPLFSIEFTVVARELDNE